MEKLIEALTNLLRVLFSLYGSYSIWIILGVAIFFISILMLRSYGILTTPLERAYIKMSDALADLKFNSNQSSMNLLNVLDEVAERQKSSLTVEEVNIITDFTYASLKYLILDKLDTLQRRNLKDITILDMEIKSYIETKVKEIDRKYFQLPNTKEAIVATSHKLEIIREDKLYEYLATNLINNKEHHRDIASTKLNELIQSWYQR